MKLNEVTLMLYRQIEENQVLSRRVESSQQQHSFFLTKLLLAQEQNNGGQKADLMAEVSQYLKTQELLLPKDLISEQP